MSSTVDTRIVEMQLKDTSFTSGVSKIIDALTKLKSGLNLKGATDSLNQLDDAGKKFSLGNIGTAVDGIASKFSAMGLVGIGILTNLASKAVEAGLEIVKGFTLEPIIDGFNNYETKINAIQTILANTSTQGTNLSQVTAALDELNKYANLTVYNFADMTKNIGTFTAAGVSLQTSVSSIKGIANLAALSGSSAEQASTAMYQLSQSIAAGKVNLQDWNSVVNAGFGGKVFQNALIQTASVHDKTVSAMITKEGGFRNSLQSGWLTAKVLTDTLNTFTGDMSKNQLVAYGYTSKEADAIIAQAKLAVNSATQIRTVTQLMSALKEEVGSAWAKVFEALIGNINDATGVLSAAHNVLENLFTTPILNFAKFLAQWSALGGRDALIDAIVNSFNALKAVLTPIGQAFRDVFPPATAAELVKITDAIRDFTDGLMISGETAKNIRSTFDGIFSILKIGVDVVVAVGKGIAQMFGGAQDGATGLLSLTARLGDFITGIKNAIEQGNFLNAFFEGLGKVLAVPLSALGNLGGGFSKLGDLFGDILTKISPFTQEVGAEFSKLGSAIASSISSGGFAQVENVINQGLFGAILLAIRKFISGLGKGSGEEKAGFLDTIKESFEGLTGALQAMQTNLKSGTLEKIAIAVALLSASLLALSLINVADLTKSLSAMTIMFTELLSAMAIISKISGAEGIVKLPIIAGSLILLSTAILILSGAVAILGHLSWDELEKGLSAIAILLTELVGSLILLSKNSVGVGAAALSMEAMATAMNIMAIAVGKLGAMPWSVLEKGVGTIAALLLIFVGFNALSGDGAGLIATGAAMLIISAALVILASAVTTLGVLPLGELGKGIGAIAAAMLIMAGGLALMEAALPGAAALLVASAAIVILSTALLSFAGLSAAEMAIALVTLAGSLAIIAAALILMEASLPGSAALIIAAAALTLIAPVLVVLGALSWEAIGKGLVALAGAFTIIGLAGLLLTPIIPGLLGLGAAITLIGIGVLAAGAGVLLFGTGVVALAAGIAALGLALATFVTTVLSILPQLPTAFAAVITSFATGISKAAPAIISALTTLLTSLLNAIIKITPTLVKAFETLLDNVLKLLQQDAPKIVSAIVSMLTAMLAALTAKVPSFTAAAVAFIVAMLNGIASKLSAIVTAATNLTIQFINAIGAAGLKITAAGAAMIINFVNGLAKQINADTPQMRSAGLSLAAAIVNGMTLGISGGLSSVIGAAVNLAEGALNAAKSHLGINSPSKEFQYVGESMPEGTVVGINKGIPDVEDASTTMGKAAVAAMQKSLVGINDAIHSNIDIQPRITPILDLSQAQSGFSTLAGMSKDQLITADTSLFKAASISSDNSQAASTIGTDGTTQTAAVQFNQYNSSPKALSTADIYRQTKNQLSVAKGALPT